MPKADLNRRVSCKRCQSRKIKCSRCSPCQNCSSAGVRCEFRGDGQKRVPISREYVTALESRIGTLERLLSEIGPLQINEEPPDISTTFGMYPTPASESPGLEYLIGCSQGSSPLAGAPTYSQNTNWDHLKPVSLQSSDVLKAAAPTATHQNYGLQTVHNVPMYFNDHIMTQCVELFFRWHYPQCMIVDRDKFLLGFLNYSYPSSYPSRGLEYSVCALGALSSTDNKIRKLADEFADAATRCLEFENLLDPQETSMQALILCSFYQIGKGNFSKAWMLSETAVRMCETSLVQEASGNFKGYQSNPQDTESGRRLYANFYESDKMISLLLGRTPVLAKKPLTTAIDSLGRNSSVWQMWLTKNGLPDSHPPITSSEPSLILTYQGELCHIINDMIVRSRSLWGVAIVLSDDLRWEELVVGEINTRLLGWHNSLPGELRWNRWGSCFDTIHPSITALSMLYNIALISLNLPLLDLQFRTNSSSLNARAKIVTDALEICHSSLETIISMIQRFKSQYTLAKAPFVLAQGAIIVADTAAIITRFWADERRDIDDAFWSALDEALLDLSYSWKIAGDARSGLENKRFDKISDQLISSSPSMFSESLFSMPVSGTELCYDQSLPLISDEVFGSIV